MFREHVIVVGGLGSKGLAAIAANNLARPGVGLDVPLKQWPQRKAPSAHVALQNKIAFRGCKITSRIGLLKVLSLEILGFLTRLERATKNTYWFLNLFRDCFDFSARVMRKASALADLKGLSGEMQGGSKMGSNDAYWRTIWPLRFRFYF